MSEPAVRFSGATLEYNGRRVWTDLSIAFESGSFIAILGPNGSGKTSLLRIVLGLLPLTAGRVEVLGAQPRRGNAAIGYVPQHQSFDAELPLRGRDLVRLGVDGHRWGIGLPDPDARRRVDAAIASVDASEYAAKKDAYVASLRALTERIAQLKAKYAGTPIAFTEDVAGYLTDAIDEVQHRVHVVCDEEHRPARAAPPAAD